MKPREHTAWSQKDRLEMSIYAKAKNYEMYTLIELLYALAGRI